jgi:hypothetical protein
MSRIDTITDEGNAKVRGAKGDDVGKAQSEMVARLLAAYRDEIAKVVALLVEAQRLQKQRETTPFTVSGPMTSTPDVPADQSARMAALRGIQRQLAYEMDSVSLQAANSALKKHKEGLEGAAENAQLDKPFEDRMKALGVQLDGVKAKLAAIGQPEAAQVIAKAFGEAQKAIEEVNNSLERHHAQLSEAQKAQIKAIEQSIASAEAEATWKAHLESTTTATNDRIRSQQLLTEAIGKGYEATKKANVETQVMGAMKENYADPAFAGDAAKLRAGFGAAYDATHGDRVMRPNSGPGSAPRMTPRTATRWPARWINSATKSNLRRNSRSCRRRARRRFGRQRSPTRLSRYPRTTTQSLLRR